MNQKNIKKVPMTCEEIDQMVDDGIRLAMEQEASVVVFGPRDDASSRERSFWDWEDDESFFAEDWNEGTDDDLDRYYDYDDEDDEDDDDEYSISNCGIDFSLKSPGYWDDHYDSYNEYLMVSYWEQVYPKFSRLGQREQEGRKMTKEKKKNEKAFKARRRDRQKEERKKDRRPSRGKKMGEFNEPVDVLETIDFSWGL